MTYCVGIAVDEGLVFLSDSRTNAGVDQISTFRKITLFDRPGDRVMVLLTSGNLAISQSVVSMLREGIATDAGPNLMSVATMFHAATIVGDAVRQIHKRDADALKDTGVEFNVSFILGGQIKGEAPRLFNIYAAGNFIEATPETPYFQIGESKYGKPIIDRVITPKSSLAETAKCALISMDSTIRSNLSVGLPLDLVCIKRDALRVSHHASVDADHKYFSMIRTGWSESLRSAFQQLPDPDWLK
jgi:putative proteasome-type protease